MLNCDHAQALEELIVLLFGKNLAQKRREANLKYSFLVNCNIMCYLIIYRLPKKKFVAIRLACDTMYHHCLIGKPTFSGRKIKLNNNNNNFIYPDKRPVSQTTKVDRLVLIGDQHSFPLLMFN